MEQIIEKFGKYIHNMHVNRWSMVYVDYVFKFENGYGALLVIEKFANLELYDVATIKFKDDYNFELVKVVPETYIRAVMCRPVDEACEYLQGIKDL